jgi:hypothetical protein
MTDFNLGAALQQYKEESEITLLPAGTHTIEIVVAKAKTAKKGPSIVLMGKVAAGPQAGSRVGLGSLSFSENALWKTFPILEGCGITQDFLLQANSLQEPIKAIAEALVGRVIEATLIVDTWNNEERNKLDRAALPQQVAYQQPTPQQPPPALAAVPAPAPAPEPEQRTDVPVSVPATNPPAGQPGAQPAPPPPAQPVPPAQPSQAARAPSF